MALSRITQQKSKFTFSEVKTSNSLSVMNSMILIAVFFASHSCPAAQRKDAELCFSRSLRAFVADHSNNKSARIPRAILPALSFAEECGFEISDIKEFKQLSYSGVVSIELNDGRYFVARATTKHADIEFEEFAGAILRNAPEVHVPALRRLSPQASQQMHGAIRSDTVSSRLSKHIQPPYSLTELVPGELGEDFLRRLRAEQNTYAARETHLQKAIKNREVAPGKIRQRLSDLWVIYRLLGISDFHESNWIHSDGIIYGIDFALMTYHFHEGSEIEANMLQQPYGGKVAPPEIVPHLFSDVSPAIRQYLRDLTPAVVQRIADSVGFTLTPAAWRGIDLRRRNILDGIRSAHR